MRLTKVGPIQWDVELPQASTITLGVIITRDGSVKDITDDTVTLTVKQMRATVSAIIQQYENGVGEHSEPTAGETQFTVDKTDFAAWERAVPMRFVYEVRVNETPYMEGAWRMMPVTGKA